MVTTTVWAGELVWSGVLGKMRVEAETEGAAGAMPVPLRKAKNVPCSTLAWN